MLSHPLIRRLGLARRSRAPCFLTPRARLWSGRPDLASGIKALLHIHDEVAEAVASNRPVVALESTIYTHGALGDDLGLEEIVRSHGAVPAVVGVLDGVPIVGLTPDERKRMVDSGSAHKASRRDLAYLVGMGMTGRKLHAGTTIAGTMLLARLAGVRVFGTGGLGGVHQDGQNSMDVSADLAELGRTRVAVVSSGCKGFLDIPRTLEFLETQGVCVATFRDGRAASSVDFPAFWARESGTKSPFTVDTEEEAAAVILAQELLAIESGVLLANPIPQEFAVPRADMEAVIALAVREGVQKGHTGSANTPYILGRIRELTKGRSVAANKALVRSNVGRAARIAVELSTMLLDGGGGGDLKPGSALRRARSLRRPHSALLPSARFPKLRTAEEEAVSATATEEARADIIVAGSVAIDLSCDYVPQPGSRESYLSPRLWTSNPALIRQSIGGVGRNVALAAHLAGGKECKVKLCSLVGDDVAGATVIEALAQSGLDTTGILKLSGGGGSGLPASRTAQYVAVNDGRKELFLAAADMDIFTRHSLPEHWLSIVSASGAKWLVVDANWAEADMSAWIRAGQEHGCRVAFEPVSVAKSVRLFPEPRDGGSGSPVLGVFPRASLDLATPNIQELGAMHAAARANGYFESDAWLRMVDAMVMREGARERFIRLTSAELTDAGVPLQSVQLLPYIPTVITKLGAQGVLLTALLRPHDTRLCAVELEPYMLRQSHRVGGGGWGHPDVGGVYMRLFSPAERVPEADVVSVNGVGDTFLGVVVAGLAKAAAGAGTAAQLNVGLGAEIEELVKVGQAGAVLTLRSGEAVSETVAELGARLDEAVK